MTSGLSDTRAAPGAATIPAAQPAGIGLAVVLATAPASDGRPAALLPFQDGTVVGRLVEQLAGLGAPAPLVITRPGFEAPVRQAVGPAADVRVSGSVADDLRLIAHAARAGAGQVLVTAGDIVTHTDALESLIANPHAGTRILAGGRRRPLAFRFQARRGRLVSAASAYHAVRSPNGTFLGVLRTVPADVETLAAAAEGLAPLVADVPETWRQELERKAERWRTAFARAEVEGGDDYAGPDEPDDIDESPEEDTAAVVLSDDEETQWRTRVSAAPEDAVALLLVGLVRANVDVTPVYLRQLFWTRPLSPRGDGPRRRADHRRRPRPPAARLGRQEH